MRGNAPPRAGLTRAGLPDRTAAVGLLTAVTLTAATLAGCGVADAGPSAAGDPARGVRAPGGPAPLRVYYLTQHGTWPVTRDAPRGADAQTAVDRLLGGPTRAERARGLDSALPRGRIRARAAPGAVDLYLPWVVAELDAAAVSQLVCTAAASPGIPGGRNPLDVVVRVHESGISGTPWRVMCDETGSAAPIGASGRNR
ncbi:lipoprotein [Streptomyces albiaxialis]|uniref:Lipoprotein n=1 Tax=Streptomyces albiaxialis TaxID=329523 RepID=A0ABP5IQC8_9ACTN